MPMSKDRKKITFNALLNHKAHNYTFKFLTCSTTHENTLLLNYRRF